MKGSDETAIVIMAAGMGSRYGGLKQLDPVGPNGELLIHYTLYDAAKAGFSRVVFVIRKEFETEFIDRIGRHMPRGLTAAYAYQDVSDLPEGRKKPWGTGHAVLATRRLIDVPFGVVNADDYYGRDALTSLHSFLVSPDYGDRTFAMVGYLLRNTVSPHGAVTRGVCEVKGGVLIDITETSGIEVRDGRIGVERDGGTFVQIDPETPVSMNIWGFSPSLFGHLEALYHAFRAGAADDPKAEFLIPEVVKTLVKEGTIRVNVIDTHDRWFGMTHPEDRQVVTSEISRLIQAGVYPQKLGQ
jgi:NDP-sugar pyrophosphorylase family protein